MSLAHREALFTFIDVPGIEPINDLAERSPRHLVNEYASVALPAEDLTSQSGSCSCASLRCSYGGAEAKKRVAFRRSTMRANGVTAPRRPFVYAGRMDRQRLRNAGSTILGIVLAGIAACASDTARAATYYVSTGGRDSNAGTEAAPFRTIARGSRELAPGDTLLIRAGTYDETMIHGRDGFVFQNGTAGALTRYAAYPGEEVTVRPAAGGFVVWFSRRTSYIEVSGLRLDGTHVDNHAVRFDSDLAAGLSAHHIRLVGNDIGFSPASCVLVGRDNEIIDNDIHDAGGYGVYAYDENLVLDGNRIHDNAGYGLHLFSQDHHFNNALIRNNFFFRNGREYRRRDGTPRPLPAVIISRGSGHQFYNNVVYDNYGGVLVGYGASNALIANNTVYANDTFGIDVSGVYGGSRDAFVVNNIVWGNMGSELTDSATGTRLSSNLVDVDPAFVDVATFDFHLLADSPARDAGDTVPEVTSDLDAAPRPAGPAYDIGAFEYSSTPPSSCRAQFGALDGFELCQETEATCEIALRTAGTCRAACARAGGACVTAYDNLDVACMRGLEETCDSERGTEICVCARSPERDAGAPIDGDAGMLGGERDARVGSDAGGTRAPGPTSPPVATGCSATSSKSFVSLPMAAGLCAWVLARRRRRTSGE